VELDPARLARVARLLREQGAFLLGPLRLEQAFLARDLEAGRAQR